MVKLILVLWWPRVWSHLLTSFFLSVLFVGPKIRPRTIRTSITDKLEDEEIASTVNIRQLHVTPSYCHPLAPAISRLIALATQLTDLKREAAQIFRAAGQRELDHRWPGKSLPHLLDGITEGIVRAENLKRCLKERPSRGTRLYAGPYICENDGLLKVDGRLEHAQVLFCTQHPIIISADHQGASWGIHSCFY